MKDFQDAEAGDFLKDSISSEPQDEGESKSVEPKVDDLRIILTFL
jgi:hypothetical protein